MAVNLNDPNRLNQQQQQGQPAGAQPIQQNQQKPRTSGFTNIQRVLGANQGNKLGQAVSGGVQSLASTTKQKAVSANEDFTKQIGQANEEIAAGKNIQNTLSNVDFIKQPQSSQNLQQLNTDQAAKTSANLYRGYQGPQQLQDENILQQKAQDLQQTGQNLLTAGGRQAALQRFVNAGPNYTQGKQRLDSLLFGQNPQQLTEARRAAQQSADLTTDLLKQSKELGSNVGQTYNTLGKEIRSKVTGLGENLGQSLDQRVNQASTESQQKIQSLKDQLTAGEITDENYDYLVKNVLDNDENVYNFDSADKISSLFTNNIDYNRSNIAKQQDIDARNTLAKLAGFENADQFANLDLDETKAGTAADALVLNKQGKQLLAQQRQEASDAIKNFNYSNQFQNQQRLLNPQTDPAAPGSLTWEQASRIATDPILQYYDRSNVRGISPDWQKRADAVGQETARLYNEGLLGSHLGDYNMGRATAVDMGLQDLARQYGDTKKRFGIGNNLQNLLKRNKTFNVT